MVENLDAGKRARRTLQATALLMMLVALLLGLRSREATLRPREMAGSAGAPKPAPAAFLAARPSVQSGGGASAPDASERIAALSKVLSGGDGADPAAVAPVPAGEPAALEGPAPSEGPVDSAASAGVPGESGSPGSRPSGRAEVVARLERGGAVYWLLRVGREGRLLRAGVVSGAGAALEPAAAAAAATAPLSEPYLEEIEGRFELVTRTRRYRVVEPPWAGSHTAVVGESP
jgi:hypothetical protein